MAETLGARIRKTRQEHGMSQAELARRIGISATAMNQIESGKTPDPGVSRVKAIADVLHCTTDYLLGRTEEQDDDESEPASVSRLRTSSTGPTLLRRERPCSILSG